MSRHAWGMLLVWMLWSVAAGEARAEVRVRVVETHPAGSEVRLARNQNFYLRLAYEADAPVRIWASPYFRGERVKGGSSPSRVYSGSGEALGWFFLMDSGERVDEIRISAGDGSLDGTPVVATHRVRVAGGGEASAAGGEPQWVATMRDQERARQRQDYETRMATPVSAGDAAVAMGFMWLVLALGALGIAGPALALRHWHGGWRVAAMVPAALMGFVVLRIVFGTAIDPASHNLWPFEILRAGLLSAGAMLALVILRKLRGEGMRN